MTIVKVLFWLLLFIVLYAYVGYGILLFVIIRIRRMLGLTKLYQDHPEYEPEVTLFIAAYNEKDFVEEKIKNSRELEYPASKLHMIWITDGSNDGTPEALFNYDGVEVHHLSQRSGKIGAMNRGMQFVKTPIVIFAMPIQCLATNRFVGSLHYSVILKLVVFRVKNAFSERKKMLQQVLVKGSIGNTNQH